MRATDAAIPADATEVVFDVSGMTCGSCAARIEEVLVDQVGVEGAAVDVASNRATVVLAAPGTVDGLTAAVERIGYGLTRVPSGRPE
ncbi:MAG: heavy metal-associated domain-containing protein [bacterium]|nr:heavy metal-associated domain-containing protein [bacterium]MDE0353804.1 heavy metal-associated domain-containing protein [bacterium]